MWCSVAAQPLFGRRSRVWGLFVSAGVQDALPGQVPRSVQVVTSRSLVDKVVLAS